MVLDLIPKSDPNHGTVREVFIITTGGTIEKTYDEIEGSLSNRGSILETQIISKLRLPHLKVNTYSLFNKDSLTMTDEDRSMLFKAIVAALDKNIPIIVIHGTDTMTKSAEFCQQEFIKKKRVLKVPIIFTGAMRPLGFSDTDAIQNVNESLLAAQLVVPGFYLSFHCKVFAIPHVRKNPKLRTFEDIPV